MFKWAVENELVPVNIWHGLQAVSGLKKGRVDAPESEPVRPVSPAMIDAIQPFVAPQVWTMVQLQLLIRLKHEYITGIIPRKLWLKIRDRLWGLGIMHRGGHLW